MKNLLQKIILASTIAVSGVSVLAGSALAQATTSAPIPFNGNVPNTCTFGTPVAGTLNPNSGSRFTTDASSPNAASITLTCLGGAEVAINDLTTVSTPAGAPALANTGSGWWFVQAQTSGSTIYLNGTEITAGTPSEVATLTGAVNETITLGMDLLYVAPLVPGTYQYTTTLTATPL